MARISIDGRTRQPTYAGCQCPGGPRGIVRAVTPATPSKEPTCFACRAPLVVDFGSGNAPAIVYSAADRMEKRMSHMKNWKPDPTMREKSRRGVIPLI